MKQYLVTLTGISGERYVYGVSLPNHVPPLEAEKRAAAIHNDPAKSNEAVRPGARVRRASRCSAVAIIRWRFVRCDLEIAHRPVLGTFWHCSPKRDVWPT